MRITGGDLLGRRITVPPGVIRPAMDRMRESLFAILGPLAGLTFLDLFAGSGIMSIEAISRGAAAAVLVERDAGKRKTIISNLELVGDRARLYVAPAERFVARCRDRFDLIYLDPPFDYRFKADLIARVSNRGMLESDGRLAIHYPAAESLPERIGAFEIRDERRYGGSRVRFYACHEDAI